MVSSGSHRALLSSAAIFAFNESVCPMSSLYQSLSGQVAASLREEVQAGSWKKVLPGERQLAERLNVSRKTVRKALALLRGEGLIHTERNRPSVLLRSTGRSAKKNSAKIALLLPKPIEGARPFTVLWVNHLMALLHESGMQLEVVSGWKYFGAQAGRSLRHLIESHPHRCWILARSHRALPQWFATSKVPVVIAGSTHAGIPLSSVDIDHRALCRHAAQTFLRHGHRRLALFVEKAGHAGDDESERAFSEALASNTDAQSPLFCRPNRGSASVIRELRRLQALPSPPTGFPVNAVAG